MSRRQLALGVAAVFAAAGAGYAAAAADPPYAKRLQILETLASRYPGQVEKKSLYGKYGLWAGIAVQTKWQQATQRDRLPLWSIVNYELSVQPTEYARLLERAGPHPDVQTVCALNLARDVCGGWVRYFLGAKHGLPPAALLKLL